MNGLATHFRNLMVCKDVATIELLDVGKSVKSKYQEQAKAADLKFLLPALEICRQCDIQYRGSKNQRLLVELSLMQLASILTENNSSVEKKKPSIKAPDGFTIIDKPEEKEKKEAIPNEQTPKTVTEPNKVQAKKTVVEKPEEKTEAIKTEPKARRVNKLASLGLKSKTASLSINELTSSKEEVDAKDAEFSSDLREPFNQEQLLDTWKKLAEKIKAGQEEGSSIVCAAMSTHTPVFNESFQIHLKVDNLSQEEEVRVFRTEIHSYLRKELRNGAIELHTKILKDKKQKKAYTPEEKFNKLADKNPNLLRLKKELDLDFF